MIPLALKIRNIRTFDSLDLDLPEGLLGVIGSNGAGKSTLVNCIEAALFGPEGRSFAGWCDPDRGDARLLIELVFEHDGSGYVVQRTFDPRGRGKPSLDLIGPDLEPLNRESIAATQEHLESVIGLSRETFRASSFLAQGEAALFAEAGATQRKKILQDVLGLGQWDEWLARAKEERKQAELSFAAVAGAMDAAREELAGREDLQREAGEVALAELDAKVALDQIAKDLAAAQEREREARSAAERYALAERMVKAAEDAVGEAQAREATLIETERALAARLETRQGLQNLAGSVPALVETLEVLREAGEAWQRRTREVAEANRLRREQLAKWDQAEALLASADRAVSEPGAECDRCGRPLDDESALRAVQSYREQAAMLQKESDALGDQSDELDVNLDIHAEPPDPKAVAAANEALDRARAAERQLAALDEAGERLVGIRDELSRLRAGEADRQQALSNARADLTAVGLRDADALADAQAVVWRLQEEQRNADAAVATLARRVAQLDERLDRLDKLAQRLAEQEAETKTLSDEIALLAALERACGPNGVPALILETVAIPQIETEANRILAVLGGPARAVELRTQREKKTGGVSDTLDIVLLTETGERDYATFSGGERARVNLALRLALAQLLAQRKGAETGLLVLDELEYLDAQGTAALVEVLEGLQDRIRTIILISHLPELRDSLEQTLTLENIDGRSRVVGSMAPTREAISSRS